MFVLACVSAVLSKREEAGSGQKNMLAYVRDSIKHDKGLSLNIRSFLGKVLGDVSAIATTHIPVLITSSGH